MTMSWQIFSNPETVASEAANYILACASRAITEHQRFSIALSGGRTPQALFKLLALADADWPHWEIFYADERCLPPDSTDRNSLMASTTWLRAIELPQAQHHPMPAELGPEQAASRYAKELTNYLPLDLVVLGIGEDGHTASLFPGHSHDTDASVVPVYNSPKPPPERVSLATSTITTARDRLVVVTGADKANAVASWHNGEPLPITLATTSGATVLLDEAAAALMPR